MRRFGDRKRSKNWHQPTQISTLIRTMYLDVSCKLYYGFLQEYSTSFFRIISANVAHKKESSPFQSFIDDPTSSPSDLLIDQYLLVVFVAFFQNDIQGKYIPETHAYPPTNSSMLKVPPKLRDWRKSNTTTNTITLHQPPPHKTTIVSPHLQDTTTAVVSEEEIDVVTFEHDGNAVSVMVEDDLSHISTLEAVMKEGDVVDEFGLDGIILVEGEQLNTPACNVINVDYKFNIKRSNNSYVTFRWNKIRNMAASSLMRIKNIHEDNLIVIK